MVPWGGAGAEDNAFVVGGRRILAEVLQCWCCSAADAGAVQTAVQVAHDFEHCSYGFAHCSNDLELSSKDLNPCSKSMDLT